MSFSRSASDNLEINPFEGPSSQHNPTASTEIEASISTLHIHSEAVNSAMKEKEPSFTLFQTFLSNFNALFENAHFLVQGILSFERRTAATLPRRSRVELSTGSMSIKKSLKRASLRAMARIQRM
jgi:hypothetical protein